MSYVQVRYFFSIKCLSSDELYQQFGISLSFQTLALLSQFKSKLTQAITETPENSVPEADVEDDEGW